MVEPKPEPEIWVPVTPAQVCGASELTCCGTSVVCRICSQLSSLAWASEGVREGLGPLDLRKIFTFSFELVRQNLNTVGPNAKYFWPPLGKVHYTPP